MNIRYKGHYIELIFLSIEFPTYPIVKGARAVEVYQLRIDDEDIKICKGHRLAIMASAKKYVRFHKLLTDDESDYEDDFFVD